MKKLFVSVIIPVRELSNYLLLENLLAMAKQTYDKFEVIVLPNKKSGSDAKLLQKYKWLRIIPTNKITLPAKKRDIGVKNARGDIIAFIDDDAYPAPNWIKNAARFFKKNNISAVCGPGLLPKKTNIWEYIFDEVLKTWVGSGGFNYRFVKKKRRFVDDYPSMNFLIRKEIFVQLGGFNSQYWPGEDSKLCEDLIYKRGGLILYDPEVTVYHHRRTGPITFLKQHGNYGFHRGAFFSHGDHNSRRLAYFIPTIFVLYFLLIIILSLLFDIRLALIYLPFIIYLLLTIFLSINAYINTKNMIIALFSPLALLSMYIIYGTMFAKGLVTGFIKKDKIYG